MKVVRFCQGAGVLLTFVALWLCVKRRFFRNIVQRGSLHLPDFKNVAEFSNAPTCDMEVHPYHLPVTFNYVPLVTSEAVQQKLLSVGNL
jgi:hypothetical protein